MVDDELHDRMVAIAKRLREAQEALGLDAGATPV